MQPIDMITIIIITAVTIAVISSLIINPVLYAEAINSKLSAYINSTRNKVMNVVFENRAATDNVRRITSLCNERIEAATEHLNSTTIIDNATADHDIAALKACNRYMIATTFHMNQLINETKQDVYTILFG